MRLVTNGSLCSSNSSRGWTVSLVTWLIPNRVLNSVDSVAYSTPFSNCRYPTGVRVAGVETVGRPGFASGSPPDAICARHSPDNKRTTVILIEVFFTKQAFASTRKTYHGSQGCFEQSARKERSVHKTTGDSTVFRSGIPNPRLSNGA